MSEQEPPGYDDWFDEPEPPTLEQGRGSRPSYDAPSGTEDDVWTLPEDEPRRSRRPQSGGMVIGGHALTTTQIAIIAIAGVAIIVALIAAFGGFSSSTTPTTPPVNTHTTLPTTTTITFPAADRASSRSRRSTGRKTGSTHCRLISAWHHSNR